MSAIKYELSELQTEKAWLFGIKTKHETEFFTQIVRTLEKKQKMWSMCLANESEYFIQEIDLPVGTQNKPGYTQKNSIQHPAYSRGGNFLK